LADIITNIGFRKVLVGIHKTRRRSVAVNYFRDRVAKIANADPSEVVIDQGLNRELMLNAVGDKAKIRVVISPGAGVVNVKKLVEHAAASTPKSDKVAAAAKESEGSKNALPNSTEKRKKGEKADLK